MPYDFRVWAPPWADSVADTNDLDLMQNKIPLHIVIAEMLLLEEMAKTCGQS